MTQVAVIGIDIGKTSFHLVGLDATGAIQWKKKFSRTQLMRHMGTLPRCLVGMEACCGAHHLARGSCQSNCNWSLTSATMPESIDVHAAN